VGGTERNKTMNDWTYYANIARDDCTIVLGHNVRLLDAVKAPQERLARQASDRARLGRKVLSLPIDSNPAASRPRPTPM
jgi:hypothetical protein